MSGRSPVILGLVLGLALMSAARAAPPATVQTEINYLLGFIKSSGCEFFRNGSWYDSKQAEAHLRSKYGILAVGAGIATAEDFIEQAATKSSLSGQPYQVRCGGNDAVTSNQWLHDVLARYRAQPLPGAARTTPGAPATRLSGLTGTSVLVPDPGVTVSR
jgi:Family of unknown function (DUF5329)